MKILYFYQYFSTPEGAWGTRVYEFAKEWIKNGHEVTVLTTIYAKSDLKATKFIENQNIDGINLKVINIHISNKQKIAKRIWTFILYMLISSWYALTLKADIVISSSGPITVGIPGLISKYLRRAKLVFEVRDLWPDNAIELGVIKSPIIIMLARWLEKACYNSSSLIVALSPGMRDNIKSRSKNRNIISVPNSANMNMFDNQGVTEGSSVFSNHKVGIYTGNIGDVNNSILLFKSAKILKSRGRNDIKIVLIGDGQQREELQKRKQRDSLENFEIIGLMPKHKLVKFIKSSMLSIIPLKDSPILDTSSPNKLFESLAAGKPVIQTTNGWIKDLLEKEQCGLTVSPNNPEELADALIQFADNPQKCSTYGKNARIVAATHFDKNKLAKKMLENIEAILK